MKLKKITLLGIIICFAYFIITIIFVVTGSTNWLTAMEIITIISGIFMIPFFMIMPFSAETRDIKALSIVFATGGMILTSVAHTINLTVTTPLINNGIQVPEYFQIGKWPSVEMAVDYLAWGLFIGLAFLFSSLAIRSIHKERVLRIILFICGISCLVGFLGTILINENVWYVAPMGYGIGTVIICIKLFISCHLAESRL